MPPKQFCLHQSPLLIHMCINMLTYMSGRGGRGGAVYLYIFRYIVLYFTHYYAFSFWGHLHSVPRHSNILPPHISRYEVGDMHSSPLGGGRGNEVNVVVYFDIFCYNV